MSKPVFKLSDIKPLFETKFIKLFDLTYGEKRHYFAATRHNAEDLTCLKSDEEFKHMTADAVTCFVIICEEGEKPRLLLSYEYRYPTGQYLLSPPAGLIDPEDKELEDAAIVAAIREIKEETGITVKDSDKVACVSPLCFSTPGMTDESNALVSAVINLSDLSELNQEGALGSELFDGFKLVDREEALNILKEARDEHGNFFSVYTWAALMYFVSDMWKCC